MHAAQNAQLRCLSEGGVLRILPSAGASTMVMEAAKVLAGMGEVLFGRLALYDALSARWEHLPIARDPARPAVTRLEDLTLTCGLPGPIGPGGAEVSAADRSAEHTSELQSRGQLVCRLL